MKKVLRDLLLAALSVAFVVAWSAQARPRSKAGAPGATSSATPVDKRKPGLYWTMETDKGKIACKLYEAEAPITVRTMVGLAIAKMSYVHPETNQTMRTNFFDGLIFYRVIPGVLIQSGDLLGTGSSQPQGRASRTKAKSCRR